MPPEISQQELTEIVERAREGSAKDFYRLYSHFAKPIYNFVRRLAGSPDEAEDLTQDTFLKVHSELSKLRDPGQFKFWLFRIARNEVYQRLRRSQKRPEVSIDNEAIPYFEFLRDESHSIDPEDRMLAVELHGVVARALGELRPKYRDVFVLAVFEKMRYEDIANVVGRSLLSVKTDIYRARLTVKEAVNDYLARRTL